ncbi:hypothetical protein PCASD_15316 [Puccinia coronata f. sp. avenae]|uniref:Uncharacterized protein n=1 Tax=Puccinia coronata f. sp. avenae TaxID=200324 RepID=A0A2N5UBA1_9BASI|nr:hypothetical protein PCASD_15316 [Puccinia coronata f. sp. avenae]
MVGYDNNSKAYRLLDSESKKIVISRNVIFDEKVFPFRTNNVQLPEPTFNADVSNSLFQSPSGSTTPERVSGEEGSGTNEREEENPEHTEQLPEINQTNNNHPPVLASHIPIAFSRPSRSCGKPNYYGNPVAHLSKHNSDEPTYKQALSSPDRQQWLDAMQEEFNSLTQHNVGRLVDIPNGAHVIGGMWQLKIKRDQFGEIIKYKARWVAFGNHQIPGIDFDQTYASVGLSDTLWILFTLAVHQDHEMEQFDIATAFLNGRMEHDVYIRQVTGFEHPQYPNRVIRLDQSLYGTRQAHRQFNTDLKEKLLSLRFKNSLDDDSLYIFREGSEFIYIHMHVDNGLVFSNSKVLLSHFKHQFSQIYTLKWNNSPSLHLGLKITRNRSNNTITLSQEHYLKDVLHRFGMEHSNGNTTPLPNNLSLEKASVINNELPYQQAIGCLSYAAISTRPDITYAVNYLARFSSCYDHTHWAAVKHLLRYIKGTIDRGIIFSKTDESATKISAYTDADYDSSEYMVISDAAKHILWMRRMICTILHTPIEPADIITDVDIFNDNNGAVFLSQESAINHRSKHIDIRYHFIRELVKSYRIKTQQIDTKAMPADMLTKNAGAIVINRCCKLINNLSKNEYIRRNAEQGGLLDS